MDFSMGTKILERNDDLLTEILLRLPSRSLFKFTSVSTRWNNVITDRLFKKLYRERVRRTLACSYPHGRLLALVQTNNKYGNRIPRPFSAVHNFLPASGEDVRPTRCGSEFFPIKRGYFITSSKDGLILCGLIPKIYYVGSPITGMWEILPPPPPPEAFPDNCLSVGLSSNEDDDAFGGKITNFRVIIATGCNMDRGIPGSKVIPIETYSSRTKEWRRSRLISEIPVKIRHFIPPTFSGGFYHWITTDNNNIVAYDPSSLDEEDDDICNSGLVPKKKHKQQHVVQVIRTPCCTGSSIVWRSDNGQTMWYGVSGLYKGVEVFRRRDDSDEWACISTVGSTDTLTKDIIGITQKDIDKEREISELESDEEVNEQRSTVWMIAFIPWDPKLVMLWYWDRIYIYDCMKKIVDHEVLLDGDRQFTDQAWDWYPFFHTLSESPYNLKYDQHLKTAFPT